MEAIRHNDRGIAGIYRDYHDTRRRKIKCELPLIEDKAEGVGKWFREDGSLEWEIEYKNDKKNGKCVGYDEEGNQWFVAHFVNDIKHGLETRIYPNKMRSEISYRNGRKNGVAKWFKADGKLCLSLMYESGVLLQSGENVDFSKMLSKKNSKTKEKK